MGVRRERVILDLEDRFSGGMVKAAASTALLNKELGSLSRDSVRTRKSLSDIDRPVGDLGKSANRSTREVDKLSGRMRILADTAATLGPALIPVGAAGLPVIAGLTAGLGAAAGAAGVAILAFHGFGDAMKALDQYQLQPTAENLDKLNQAMEKIGPAGAHLARFLSELEPQLRALQNTARAGLFPGIESGISELLPLLPQVQRIVGNIAAELGRLADSAGGSLGGSDFSAFFRYLETDAATILSHFAHAVGNVAKGLADLMVAFGPLSLDFSHGLDQMAASFADWAAQLSSTQGFKDFVAYLRESGPQVLDLLGALGGALVGLVRAAAPWGSVVLPILTDFADVLATIANSPAGPALFTMTAGFIALNRATSLLRPSLSGLSETFLDLRTSPNLAATAVERFGRAGKMAAGAAGIGLMVASVGQTNDALRDLEGAAGGALAGFAAGGPWGAAIGGGIGLLSSFATANHTASAYVEALTASLDQQTGALTASSQQVAANALEQSGALKIAEDLGINLGLVTNAALGNKAAIAELTGVIGDFTGVQTADQVNNTTGAMSTQANMAADLAQKIFGLSGDTKSAIASQQRVAAATVGVAAAFGQQSTQVDAAAAKLQAARTAARQTAQGFITLGADLDDSKVSLREWLHQLEQQADALEHFADNAVKAGDRGLRKGLIKALEEAGPAGALRMKQLADGTDAEIKRANRAWHAGREAIRHYTDAVGGVPKSVTTDVEVRAAAALAAAARINREIRNIPLRWQTDYYVIQHNAISKRAQVADAQAHADGGTVRGSRYPYADKVLAMLAPGEEVITNRRGEADRFRADRAAGRIPAYADGGRVGRATGSGAAIDYGRLGREVANAMTDTQLMGFRHARDAHLSALRTALSETPVQRVPRGLLDGMVR